MSLDLPKLVAVELPLNVKNPPKAVEMLGGSSSISTAIQDGEPLELRLRPNDRYSHPIEGKLVKTDNIVVKISVSKKEFREKYNGDIREYLKATTKDEGLYYKVSPSFLVSKTYRFREMADFQYITKNSPFVQSVENSIYSGELHNLQNLNLDTDKYPWSAHGYPAKDEDLDLPPPPKFSTVRVPAVYNFQSNTKVIAATDPKTGRTKFYNTNKAPALHLKILSWNDETPSGPRIELQQEWEQWKDMVSEVLRQQGEEDNISRVFPGKLSFNPHEVSEQVNKAMVGDLELGQAFQKLTAVDLIQKMLEKEPVMLRRQIDGLLPPNLRRHLKKILPIVSYSFRKGNWRNTCIRYGVDPRSDRLFSIYQSEAFRLPAFKGDEEGSKPGENIDIENDLQFTGEKFPSSLLFLIKDLTDPDVKRIFEQNKGKLYNDTVDENFGWFKPKILTAIRLVVRLKLAYLYKGLQVPEDKVNKIIDHIDDDETDRPEANQQEADDDDDDADDDDDDGEGEGDDDEVIETGNNDDSEDVAIQDAILQDLLQGHTEQELLRKVGEINPKYAAELKGLVGVIKGE